MGTLAACEPAHCERGEATGDGQGQRQEDSLTPVEEAIETGLDLDAVYRDLEQ